MASIAVVGGGVAGLCCAWRLQCAGHDVEVLEREDLAGGRMRSVRRGDFLVDHGAQFVASGYRNLHAVAAEVGLADAVRPIARAHDAFLRDGRLYAQDPSDLRQLLRSGLLSRRARLRSAGLALELARRWPSLDPWAPERAAEFDYEDLASGLRRTVGAEALEYLFGPAFSATFDSDPEDLSLAFGLIFLRLVAEDFELQTFEGGPGRLTHELAACVPVRTGCSVVAIETGTDGARVRYRRGSHEDCVVADAVVVALPGSAVVAACPKLTPAERGFFAHVDYGRGILVHLFFEREPRTLPYRSISFPRSEQHDLYGLAVDHHKPGAAPHGAGLINAALTAHASDRMWDASDAACADLVLENLAYTPVGRLDPIAFGVQRHDPLLPRPRAGFLGHLARFLARIDRSPRLAFAGDYLALPTAEGAVTSGLRAAAEITAEL